MKEINYKLKERSWMARIAAWKLGSSSVAFVLGNTIHLHNVSKQDFLLNARWVKHELKHIAQFREHGYFSFIWKYMVESLKNGYYNNKYEVEARQAEDL